MQIFEKKYSYFLLLIGLLLTLFSYGIFNTGICAWIFAIPLIRYINIKTKWKSIFLMFLGMIIVANITFYKLVEDVFSINNIIFSSFNGIRIWFPFFIYFLCRYFKTKKIIGYFAFPAAVAICEFFIDNPFISVMTSLSVSQFWNIGLMQIASITGVVGVSFLVTLFASIINYSLEIGINKKTIINISCYGILVLIITSLGMFQITNITTTDKTIRVAAGIENYNYLLENKSIDMNNALKNMDVIIDTYIEVLNNRANDATNNKSKLLVFPEDAFAFPESFLDNFIKEAKEIAKKNQLNILLPILTLPEKEGEKRRNTLNFINNKGELINTYIKNNLVPIVEEPFAEKGDGRTPIVDVDGIKLTYLICADFTSNKLAYNGAKADIFINPSYDWEAFQYFTSYAIQARAIECGFSVLRNPVNGNVLLYDYFGRPLHMANVLNVHTGIIYFDIPKEGRETIYEKTGNWFPWACAIYVVFALFSGLIIKEKYINEIYKKYKENT